MSSHTNFFPPRPIFVFIYFKPHRLFSSFPSAYFFLFFLENLWFSRISKTFTLVQSCCSLRCACGKGYIHSQLEFRSRYFRPFASSSQLSGGAIIIMFTIHHRVSERQPADSSSCCFWAVSAVFLSYIARVIRPQRFEIPATRFATRFKIYCLDTTRRNGRLLFFIAAAAAVRICSSSDAVMIFWHFSVIWLCLHSFPCLFVIITSPCRQKNVATGHKQE